MSKDRRLVFVIDEFPYLEDYDGFFSSLLQNTIDRICNLNLQESPSSKRSERWRGMEK